LALERQIGLRAVESRWRRLMGDDYDRARGWFMPESGLARFVPHPDERRPDLEVVHHSPDDIVGVDTDDGTSIPLTRQELVVYAFDVDRLVRAAAGAFGMDPDGQAVPGTCWAFWVCRYEARPGLSFPVVLTIATEASTYRTTVGTLLGIIPGPFLVLSPTNQHARMTTSLALEQRPAVLLPLADSLACQPDGDWRLTPVGEACLAQFRARVLPPPAPPAHEDCFPTPAGGRWSELTLRFQDGHTLWASIGSVGRAVSCERLGLLDRRTQRPNKQWELLRAFAQKHGRITWGSSVAGRQNQKVKERLVNALRDYFQIEGEPIRLEEEGGWATVFVIIDLR
jgi:hypothetical protein